MTDIIIRTKGRGILFDNNVIPTVAPEMFSRRHWWDRGLAERAAAGRGTVLFVGVSQPDWALRHYHRGGYVGRFLTDHFFWAGEEKSRSFMEWTLLKRLHGMGLPVPKPVAAHYARRHLAYTADLITERIPSASPLSAHLAGAGVSLETWHAIGAAVRGFHEAQVFHADLTAHNIMLNDMGKMFLLDFDRGEIRNDESWKEDNLSRLQRSLNKIRVTMDDVDLSKGYWESFLEGYATG